MKNARSAVLGCVSLALALGLGACDRRPAKEDAETASSLPAPDSAEISIHKRSETEALELTRSFVASGGGTVTVRAPYVESGFERVPCSPMEVESDRSALPHNPELWRCKTVAGGATYFKQQPVTKTRCCKERRVSLPPQATWSSSYSEADKAWRVKAEFDFGEEQQRQDAEWTVDDETGKVSEVSPSNG